MANGRLGLIWIVMEYGGPAKAIGLGIAKCFGRNLKNGLVMGSHGKAFVCAV